MGSHPDFHGFPSDNIIMDEFYREWVDGLADSSRFERTDEVKLEARLYDAFLRFPTLKAKQNAVVTMEAWPKQYDELGPDDAA